MAHSRLNVGSLGRVLAAFLFIALATCAMAEPEFLKIFTDFYHPTGDLAKAKCQTCHVPQGPPTRNAYGRQVDALLEPASGGSGKPTIDDFIYLEKQDSDGDGYTNYEEILAGTLPGDKNSHPKAHLANIPYHHLSRKFNPLFLKILGGLVVLTVLFAIGAKTGKVSYMAILAKVGVALSALAIVGVAIDWFLSNTHP